MKRALRWLVGTAVVGSLMEVAVVAITRQAQRAEDEGYAEMLRRTS